jgi:site-specific recombinase XerD
MKRMQSTKTVLPKEQELKRLLKKLLAEEEEESLHPKYPQHREAIEPWKRAMASGTLSGKVFSPHTVKNYARYVDEYLAKYPQLTFDDFQTELELTPAESFGRRDKYFKAILCFARFLIREESLSQLFVDKAIAIQPKRHIPAKQASVNEEQLQQLLTASTNPLNRLIIHLLSSTGLRAAEFCALKYQDVNLAEGYLTVQRGKGGKRRRVGLPPSVHQLLTVHMNTLANQNPEASLFINILGQPMTRDGLLNRIRKLGQKIGISVSPHALRRAFVTINANKGRSLVMLQMACGHSDIKTTRSYCKTSEDEMIQAMKEW